MKKILLTFFFFVIAWVRVDGQVTFEKKIPWVEHSFQKGHKTFDGGYIIASKYELTASGTEFGFLIKTDSIGNLSWYKTFYGGFYFDSRALIQTKDSGYVLASLNTANPISIIKTDKSGNNIWQKGFMSGPGNPAISILQTNDNGFIISSASGKNFQVDSMDVLIIKTNSNGDTLWTKIFGGTGNESGNSVQQTMDDDFLILGSTTSFGAGKNDFYLIKTNSIGDTLWTKTYGGMEDDLGNSLSLTTDSGYILCGSTKSFGASGSDIYVIRTNKTGEVVWSKTYGGVDDVSGFSISQTNDIGFIIGGGSSLHSYLIKINSGGDTLWTRQKNNISYSPINHVERTGDGYLAISRAFIFKTDSSGNNECNDSVTSINVSDVNTDVSSSAAKISSGATISSLTLTSNKPFYFNSVCSSVDITEIVNENDFSIFPNPSQGEFVVHSARFSINRIEIFNVLGEKFFESQPCSQLFSFQLLVSKGIYFVKIFSGEKISTQKLIIN